MAVNTKYMYQNKWTNEYVRLYAEKQETYDEPGLTIIENGTILPTESSKDLSWGLGGVLDSNDNFVESSKVGTNAFGGKYCYDTTRIKRLDDTVLFIGIIPKHWGHFLIDTISHLWPVLRKEFEECTVAFCGYGWENNAIAGNYLEALELLGISPDHMLFVTEPLCVRKIIIPDATMGFASNYHKRFVDTIHRMIENALSESYCATLEPKEKIYFTRTNFIKSRFNEVGEIDIEKMFSNAGYYVLSPEKLSLIEQIFYIRNCNEMVSMSGTIPHNVVFAKQDMKLIILNRTCIVNQPQVRLNKLFQVDCVFIDVYSKRVLKKQVDYGSGPFEIEINDNLLRFFNDNNLETEKHNKIYIKIIRYKNTIRYEMLVLLKYFKDKKIYKTLKKLYLNTKK